MKNGSIAIIGSGISGLAAAYFLADKYHIKLFEKNDYLGGHSNTVIADYNGHKIPVDTGFIVFNHQTYPNLKSFFELLMVECQKSNMSFAIKVDDGCFEYAGTNLTTVFAQLKNALNPQFWWMLSDIIKFNKRAIEVLEKPFDANYNLGKFLDELGVKDYFRQFYLLPMSGAIWSCPLETMLSYPAQSFVRFFKNHGLLTVANQPQWYSVKGGSIEYVKKIQTKISDNIALSSEVFSVSRIDGEGVLVKSAQGLEKFDAVLFACHGDQVLKILQNPTPQELAVFSSFSYQKNLAVLHCDQSLMPNSKRAWASWVYANNHNNNAGISITYWMNNLQNIDPNFPLFVTLNPHKEIPEDKVFGRFIYEHPIFNTSAVVAQEKIKAIQGNDRLYFCGAYQKYGFHEDGISSAILAINKMGVVVPWQS